ncbi:MAG: valine--tRNA ligase [Actinobacteria bacterium]|nr:valine--tRNA ligase [Actinomycetota bacterium]
MLDELFDKLQDKYNPDDFERKIYQLWLDNNYFQGIIDNTKKPFSIVIPPPNVTGYLHVGHALNNTLQDIVIRYKRMRGFSACWIPGTDHAGIATQNVVEKELNKAGITRFRLGREKFIEKVWEWRNQYGSRIISQLKSLGSSCDWNRLRFTLDDDYIRAVNKEFVILFNAGLLYRGNYIVNWCPRCLTAISDIEVEHSNKKSILWDIKYPLIDKETGKPSTTEFIVVSTTRPETMLGDTAVAINPKDKRYKSYIGRFAQLPLMKRKIPIIADDYVDMNFGTGAVKVTPSHDPNDFEIGKRHKLEEINVMTDSAMMNASAGKYEGLDRYEARKKVIADLEKSGLLQGKKDHVSSVGSCSRCDIIIEPRVSLQWYVSMKKLAEPAIAAVREGKVKIIPKKWEKLYFNWMENIRDWCISRQLWWGHRIPVWYCMDCNETIVSEIPPEKCSKCSSTNLKQDNSVLDTWFSSCLWPFASMGWPKDTPELHYFFPTSVLITAHDIIFFWVARMIMMSLYFMKEVPFKEVFINPLVNDVYGQKMSKSRGNVVDPIEIINKYGADSLRYTLASLTTPGKNLLLGQEKIEGARNFANKLWNAAKFLIYCMDNGKDFYPAKIKSSELKLNLWDKWILSRFAKTIKTAEKYLEKYNFSFACRILNNFFWKDYCDWYIEASKVRIAKNFKNDKTTALYILWYILEKYLKLLHPFMPFITEKIWQNIPHEGESIMIEKIPGSGDRVLGRIDNKSEKELLSIFEIVGEIRRLRSELKINPAVKIKAYVKAASKELSELLANNSTYIYSLAKLELLSLTEPEDRKGFVKSVKGGSEIYIYLLDAIDIELEIKRLRDEISRLKIEMEKSNKKISNPQFMEKAPKDIIGKESEKFKRSNHDLKILYDQLEKMQEIKK